MRRVSAAISLISLVLLGPATLLAQQLAQRQRLGLEQALARDPDGNRLILEGKEITVSGIVTNHAVAFREYTHLAIGDDTGTGLVLEGPDFMFEQVAPGDTLEVTGVVAQRDGMAVLRPVQLTTMSRKTPPAPRTMTLDQLRSARYLGRAVTVEGRVVALGQDDHGEYLVLGDGHAAYMIYLPRAANRLGAGLSRYRVGDGIRATGVASQAPAGTREGGNYRLEVSDATGVVLLDRSWLVSPQALFAVLVVFCGLAGAKFHGRQRNIGVRLSVRRIYNFVEELLTADGSEDVMRKLRNVAPRALEASAVEVYSYDRGTKQLRPLLAVPEGEAVLVQASRRRRDNSPLDAKEARAAAIALCFRNRTPLHIADTRRSPLFRQEMPANRPLGGGFRGAKLRPGGFRAMVLLPMFAREELIGVFEVTHLDRPRRFISEELSALQHLANHIAVVWQVLDRQARKEQMLRTERLAATGQVISGVTGELKGPLDSILALAHRLLEQEDPQARALLDQSMRASAILHRYSQVAKLEEATAVELNPIVQRAAESVRQELPVDVHLTMTLSQEPIWILTSAAQLEDVVRNMLLHASASARVSLDRSLHVESTVQGRRVMITIRYGALLCDEQFPTDFGSGGQALGFSVCKGIVHGMGGDVLVLAAGENVCRIEIELPAAFPTNGTNEARKDEPTLPRQAFTPLTAVILEPDAAAQKRLVSYWTAKRHRAVPVHNDTEALELMRRFRVDVVFCAVRFGPGNWADFFDRVRGHAQVFVLLAEAMDSDATLFFPQGEGLLLRKPLEAGEFSRLLERIEQRLAVNGAGGSPETYSTLSAT